MSYWWMSFVDPHEPEGEQFLGALIIVADTREDMMVRSWMLDLNPGGEVAFFEIPKQYEYRIPPEWIETRLLTEEEVLDFEKKWAQ
jgi:hypothetical protein